MAGGDETDGRADAAARIAFLEAALAERDAKLAEQHVKIAALTEQVAKLTELLGRNSRNSHLPPSSDGPGSSSSGGTTGHRKLKPGRKRGGQKGHRGSHRKLLPPERVDTLVDLFPEVCLGCACRLRRVVDAAAYR